MLRIMAWLRHTKLLSVSRKCLYATEAHGHTVSTAGSVYAWIS